MSRRWLLALLLALPGCAGTRHVFWSPSMLQYGGGPARHTINAPLFGPYGSSASTTQPPTFEPVPDSNP